MHLMDTVEVRLWKNKIRQALKDEEQHAIDEEELLFLKQESLRLKIKIPDVLTISTARIIP